MTTLLILTSLLSAVAHAGIPGGLDKNAIDQTVKKDLPKIRDCYENNTADLSPKPTGKVNTRFTIAGDGKVGSAEILNSEIKNEAVESCLATELRNLVFPAPKGGGTVEVDYPFVFKSDAKPAKRRKKRAP